ncbi:MAG: sigma 54-interacting transcriptional regulator [Planctomycetaceae bacterium]|nr:sigma 54-interacting transcriptional regulator [Planctomycetaceae bacterium]
MSEENSQEAFLLSWDGSSWRDVVRLRQGQVISVGRSTTNKLVLHDDACSRHHCEVFFSNGDWKLRDLDSRNGTLIGDRKAEGDVALKTGDILSIGQCRLAFTTDLESQPVPEGGSGTIIESETIPGPPGIPKEELSILHRSLAPGFLSDNEESVRDTNHQKELTRLYKLGLELGSATSRQQLTEVVLKNLAAETVADISAVLLVRPDASDRPAPSDLLVVAYQSREDLPYRRVSDNLSRVVLSTKEAVLARDVQDDKQLAVFDSLGEMRAVSVICAPIHCDDRIRGLIHLYATNPDNALDKHDLEYTQAAARQLALALDHHTERDSLKSGLNQARNENRSLRQQLNDDYRLIGDSTPMRELREKISLIAETTANVLIRGESGCGKELIARTIHASSPRHDGPFVCINCAALNESLLESELFGHEKGAFTGASERKIGRFEQADRGTLFLDEVGEMSPAIQAKFLRVLEGHSFERIGGRKAIDVDVRIVAATNRDLEEAVEDGDFRKDLYFRLHVAELYAQPLRERVEDVSRLANFFLRKFVEKTGRVISGFTDDAMEKLMQYEWPGNVRELQNTIERTVILCRNEVVRASDVQLSALAGRLASSDAAAAAHHDYRELSLADVERDHILATLDFTDWNKSRAAQILGIERSTLDRKLKRYHVSRPD